MRYTQFEDWTVFFRLKTVPAILQAYINDCLWPYIDHFTVQSQNNILIEWTNDKKHENHVCSLLQRLQRFALYCDAGKCQFGGNEVGFLWFIINFDGISMESDCVSTFEDWPDPQLVQNVKVWLGFACLYRLFIGKYAKVTLPMPELLRKTATSNASKPARSHISLLTHGNGHVRPDVHFRSFGGRSPEHQSSTISAKQSQSFLRPLKVAG